MQRNVVGYVVEGGDWSCVECATDADKAGRKVVSYLPADMARYGAECVDCRQWIEGHPKGEA